MGGDPLVRPAHPGVAVGDGGELGERAVQDDVLGGPGRPGPAVGQVGELAVGRAEGGVHAAQGVAERGQRPGGGGRVAFHQGLQRRGARVLDQGEGGAEVAAAGVERQQPGHPHVRRGQGRVAGGEQVRSRRVGEGVVLDRRGRRPVVLTLRPDVEDHAGRVVQPEPVDALLAAAGQPVERGRPPVGAELLGDQVAHVVGPQKGSGHDRFLSSRARRTAR
ncbi:hypothetical protein AB0C33_46185 [Nonomuraea sp. NPDC048881]|uniref:hypothetical protein n=1 Tax=Nonomuraea sp. NPDC048881 TaxID=3155030 RepID=UPI0033D324CE